MITVSADYFSSYDFCLSAIYFVYVFRIKDDVLYVGESSNAIVRIEEHISGSRTNKLLSNILSTRDDYEIDLYDAFDLIAFSEEYDLINLPDDERDVLFSLSKSHIRKLFEQHLINKLSPAFNTKDINGISNKSKRKDTARKYSNKKPVIVPNVWE